MTDNNPATEVTKRNAVVYPVGRDPEGKQIWSVSTIGQVLLERVLMTEISADVFDKVVDVVWDTEPSLVRGTHINPNWLTWFMATHNASKEDANAEAHRRLDLYKGRNSKL